MSNKSRKTTSVLALLTRVNAQLARTDESATKDWKSGLCMMIEVVLHETNNYVGYSYVGDRQPERDTLGYYSRRYLVNKALK